MKKIILIMAVFMLAAPALARVDITCEQIDDTNEVVVYYDAEPEGAVEPNLIRAFALDITLDTDANIVDVDDEVNPYYWVFPGSYPDGTARCDWEEYDGTKGEEPNQMTTEQGSLYSPDDEEGHTTPPGMSGDLFTFLIDASSGTHHVTIAQNTIRGGVVSERIVAVPAYEPDVNCTPCTVTLPPEDCFSGTEGEFAEWEAWGKPESWCYSCWRCGDVSGDSLLSFGDVMQVFNDFKNADTTGRSDANMDGLLSFGDVMRVFNQFKDGLGCTPCE